MAEKKSSTKKTKSWSKQAIKEGFLEEVLVNGSVPVSVFAFCKSNGYTETSFYKNYNSFDHLENDIWKSWLEETIAGLEADNGYHDYTVQEKLLAFYYVWMQQLLNHRSYAAMRLGQMSKDHLPSYLRGLKETFDLFIHDLMIEGKDTREIANRPFDRVYPKGFWIQFLLIHQFWLKDMSEGFEETDAFIEKSVRFSSDFIARGPLDSLQDLAKFMMQHKNTWV
jgi:hypothetical protein